MVLVQHWETSLWWLIQLYVFHQKMPDMTNRLWILNRGSIVKSRTFLPAQVLLGNNITNELSLLKGSDGSSEVYYSCLQNPTAAALLDSIDHAPFSLPTKFACDQRIASPSIRLLCSHNYNRKSFFVRLVSRAMDHRVVCTNWLGFA